MYQVEMHQPTEAFAQCWQAAVGHIQRQAQGPLRSWLKASLVPPFLEHLSFRLGNQLFFIRLEDRDGALETPGNPGGLLRIADGCAGHPCLMPLREAAGVWSPDEPGWGLVHARTGGPVVPPALITDELIRRVKAPAADEGEGSMQADGMIHMAAQALLEAVSIAAPARRRRGDPRRRKGNPVSITFDAEQSLLAISEAVYGLAGHCVPATGHWPGRVQVAGDVLRGLAAKYAADDRLTLIVTRDELSLLKDGSRISLKRLDARDTRGIDEKPLPPNRKHKGPVIVPPDPVEKRHEWNDTWAFSARVPIPQHRKPRR